MRPKSDSAAGNTDLCQRTQTHREKNRRNTLNVNGRLPPAPQALRPSLSSLLPAGGASKRVVSGTNPATVQQGISVGTALHASVSGQEAGCHLEGGGTDFSCLPGRDGSNYPGSPLGIYYVCSLFTQPAARKTMSSGGRPSGMDYRNRAPEKVRVRSGDVKPSVAANSETEFESASMAVGEASAPPLADRPKLREELRSGDYRQGTFRKESA